MPITSARKAACRDVSAFREQSVIDTMFTLGEQAVVLSGFVRRRAVEMQAAGYDATAVTCDVTDDSVHARSAVAACRFDDNHVRPHNALDCLTPIEFIGKR